MRRYKRKHVKSAKFFRDSGTKRIDVILSKESELISLFEGIIAHCAKVLSDIEIEEVVTILLHDKKAMLKQRNFPLIYEEMLSDLIKAQRKRYGVWTKKDKKRKLGYSVSLGKLEEIIGQYCNLEKVFIHSIHVGNNIPGAKTIVLGASKEKDDRVLFVSFHGKELHSK